MIKFIFLILYAAYCILNTNILAVIKINEIYPAPTSGEFEWVELYNDSDQDAPIAIYTLTDLLGNKLKFETATISAHGFTIATSSGVLNNSGDTVVLKDEFNQTLDIATYSASFNSTESYASCPDGAGSYFKLNALSKNISNNISCIVLTPTLAAIIIPSPTSQPTPTVTPPIMTYNNIYISEIMVNPDDEQNEWIELYNNNDFPVTLTNWHIDDVADVGSTPKVFSIEISAKGYGVINLPSAIFNNSGDSVRLLDVNQNVKDSLSYIESIKGKTHGRFSFDLQALCPQEKSSGLPNNPCIIIEVSPTPTIKIYSLSDSAPQVISQEKILNTLKPATTPQFANYQPSPIPSNFEQPEVLGEGDINTPVNETKSLPKTFSIISLSYSLLTIVSVFLRIKIG